MLPVLNIGPLALQFPGLILILGLWLGLSLAERFAPKRGIPSNLLYNLVFVALIAGVIGARLTYVFRYPQIFAQDLRSVISLNLGLLDPWGGVVIAGIAAVVYGQRMELKFWQTLDALTPGFAVFSIAWGLSNLASGASFGAPTDLPWCIELWGACRHPSQVYHTLAATLILILLWPGRSWVKGSTPGVYSLTFIVLTAGSALFLEAFRGDSKLLPGGFRSEQIAAWVILAAGLWGLAKLRTTQPESPPYEQA